MPATSEAVTANTLKAFNITGVNQLVTLTSGLVSVPSGGNNVFLRGIGSPSTGYNEAQVAVYVDGLYLANPAVGIYSFNNIDRIEVLKGPQGTLYGRKVTGGLISVITHDPDEGERHLDASVGYANYDNVQTNVYATTPITDTLAANVAVFHQKQSRGWSRNVFLGTDVQRTDETGIESKLKWRPGSKTTIIATFIYDYNNHNIGSAYQVEPGTLGSDGTPFLGNCRSSATIASPRVRCHRDRPTSTSASSRPSTTSASPPCRASPATRRATRSSPSRAARRSSARSPSRQRSTCSMRRTRPSARNCS
nr:TonB-dependent receptor plug domain-containing protein [Sphingomonas bacterium]